MNKIFGMALFLIASASHATLIDFQDVASGNCAFSGNSVTSQGFNFTGNPSDPALFVCNAGVNGNNTSAALIDANSLSIVTMTAADSSLFSLESLFAGSRTKDFNTSEVSSYGLSTGIEVVGTQLGGATITETITFNFLDFDAFTLSGSFTNLSSVTFTSIGGGITEFLIDDITVNTIASVPAPSILALLALGLTGIVISRRKN